MKELSIEEKARRYDEAIKVASKYKDIQIMFPSIKDEMFSELKEDWDERIRKALIDGFTVMKESKNCGKTFSNHNIPVADILAWLEKQSDKDKLIKELGKYKAKYTQEVLEKHLNSMSNKDDERLRKTTISFLKEFADKGYENAVECIDWLEKQAEQKHTEEYNITGIGSKHAQGKLGEMIKNLKPINKVLDQKSVDKVEPKFKVGDWIVTNKNHIWHVDETPETTSYLYRLISQYGKVEVAEFEVVDNTARLWSIEDVKDCDVLATEPIEGCHSPFVAIYRKKNEEDFDSYCFIGFDGKFYKGENGHSTEKIHPATKEQHDALMKAMSDAGYTFDFEKKELNKIDESHIEEINGEDYGIDGLWHAQHILEKTLGEVEGYQSDDGILEHKCAISAVKSLYEQKPAECGEEDERMYRGLHNLIYSAPYCDSRKEFSDWLESLKERAQQQPKQELSEADEKLTNRIEGWLDTLCDYLKDDNSPECIEDVKDILKQLKSLKDNVQQQPKQEWSEEDEQILNATILHIKNEIYNYYGEYSTEQIMQWFKSLKDRVLPQPKQDSTDRFFEGFKKGEQSVIENYGKYGLCKPAEWSKEDEKYSSYICSALDCYYRLREDRNNTNGQEDLDKARDWLYNKLKSFKDRYTWKPSDEQITWLYRAADEANKDSRMRQILNELLSDLKKLKDE